jgi:hypothetical protein
MPAPTFHMAPMQGMGGTRVVVARQRTPEGGASQARLEAAVTRAPCGALWVKRSNGSLKAPGRLTSLSGTYAARGGARRSW